METPEARRYQLQERQIAGALQRIRAEVCKLEKKLQEKNCACESLRAKFSELKKKLKQSTDSKKSPREKNSIGQQLQAVMKHQRKVLVELEKKVLSLQQKKSALATAASRHSVSQKKIQQRLSDGQHVQALVREIACGEHALIAGLFRRQPGVVSQGTVPSENGAGVSSDKSAGQGTQVLSALRDQGPVAEDRSADSLSAEVPVTVCVREHDIQMAQKHNQATQEGPGFSEDRSQQSPGRDDPRQHSPQPENPSDCTQYFDEKIKSLQTWEVEGRKALELEYETDTGSSLRLVLRTEQARQGSHEVPGSEDREVLGVELIADSKRDSRWLYAEQKKLRHALEARGFTVGSVVVSYGRELAA